MDNNVAPCVSNQLVANKLAISKPKLVLMIFLPPNSQNSINAALKKNSGKMYLQYECAAVVINKELEQNAKDK